MLSPVSTWMGDRLGILGAVGQTFPFLVILFKVAIQSEGTMS